MTDLELVKANVLEDEYPNFEDSYIEQLLEKHKSVPYVSYKLALMKGHSGKVVLGPVTLNQSPDFWKNLANLFLKEWETEEAEKLDGARNGTSGVKFMRRGDFQ